MGLDEFDYPSEVDPTALQRNNYRNILENRGAGETESIIFHNTEVHKLRNKVGADVVALIIDKNYADYASNFGNGISGDVWGGDESCVLADSTYDAATDMCPDRAYLVVNRNSRHHFVFTHELYHLFTGTGYSGECNTNSYAAPFFAPCFQTISKGRGDCGTCVDAGANVIVSGVGTRLTPRIPLFTGPNVAYSGYPLDDTVYCEATSSDLTEAECFDHAAPILANFRAKKKTKPVEITFAFVVSVAFVFALGAMRMKHRRIQSDGDLDAGLYTMKNIDAADVEKKAVSTLPVITNG